MKNSELLFSNSSDFFFILHKTIIAVNQFVDTQEYAVIKKRIKINKKKVIRKIIFMCDKDEKMKSQNFENRKTSTQVCECSCEIMITLKSKN